MKLIRSISFFAILLTLCCCESFGLRHARATEEFEKMFEKRVASVQDVCNFFPQNVKESHDFTTFVVSHVQKKFDDMVALDEEERTFENTARVLDQIGEICLSANEALLVLEMSSPDDEVRKTSHEEMIKLRAFCVDLFLQKKLYRVFKSYVEGNAKKESLSDEQRFFLTKTIRDFKRDGLDLHEDKLEAVKDLNKEVSRLSLLFNTNVATDKNSIKVSREDLDGVAEHIVKAFDTDDQGNYIVKCDYPTYKEVMEHCKVEETRKQLYFAFNNRAYPQNAELLEKIIAKRDILARMLGFESFAALDIDYKMAQTPERVEEFVKDLQEKSRDKYRKEMDEFKNNIPEGVSLDEAGRFNPWDLYYIKSCYKKKFFDIDDRKIAEYFEEEHTLQKIFEIYQKFLGLKFTKVKPSWVWHKDVQLIQINDEKSGALRGFIFLDLYPRQNKYSHACHCGVIKTLLGRKDGGVTEKTPSMAVVLANFPKSTGDRPALLTHSDVEIFFHEFGHAMHAVLGSTEMAEFSGTSVKLDFVEVPSQMFEEWMFDKEILKSITSHYKTHEPLPDKFIDRLVALKKFDSGYFVTRQCIFSSVALDLFKKGVSKNVDEIVLNLHRKYLPHVRYEPTTHFYASFCHLTDYGAKYYSYMWSKVFALDLFYKIKKEGLLNPEAGRVIVDKILGKGGSIDPNVLLKDYLGREPNSDAFLQDLGFSK